MTYEEKMLAEVERDKTIDKAIKEIAPILDKYKITPMMLDLIKRELDFYLSDYVVTWSKYTSK